MVCPPSFPGVQSFCLLGVFSNIHVLPNLLQTLFAPFKWSRSIESDRLRAQIIHILDGDFPSQKPSSHGGTPPWRAGKLHDSSTALRKEFRQHRAIRIRLWANVTYSADTKKENRDYYHNMVISPNIPIIPITSPWKYRDMVIFMGMLWGFYGDFNGILWWSYGILWWFHGIFHGT